MLATMQPKTHFDRNTKVKFMFKLMEKIHVASRSKLSEKSYPDPKKTFRIHNNGR